MEQQILGSVMQPCFTTVQEFEEASMKTTYGTNFSFLHKYREHVMAMEIIANCAKSYILNNYTEVKDWGDLEVTITDNSKKSTYYVKYVPGQWVGDAMKKMDDYLKEQHNPIVTFTDVVLDPTDGDFSITLNGKDHLWIDDQSVIIIANYIEENIK